MILCRALKGTLPGYGAGDGDTSPRSFSGSGVYRFTGVCLDLSPTRAWRILWKGYEREPLQLTDRQDLICRTLAGKSANLAGLYHCALIVMSSLSVGGRLFLAAHAVREMMNELPKTMDLPMLSEQARLADRVNALEWGWTRALAGKCHQNGKWSGEIDRTLQRLLQALNEFFTSVPSAPLKHVRY